MRKLLFCVALLLLTNAPASGQTTTEAQPSPTHGAAEAARLLKSEGHRERAWGAYLAGAHGLKEHAPLLTGLLEDPRLAAGGWEDGIVRQAAFDALIRLDAEVAADTLLPLYAASANEVLILLSRSPKQNERALLSLFDEQLPDARWAALGNLLAGERTAGFAARLLAALRVSAEVHVYDSEGERGYGGGGGFSSGGGCPPYRTSEGFPPVGYYRLSTDGFRGSVVFAPGRHAVYYRRTPRPNLCGSDCDGWVPRDERRVQYVAEMLGTTEEELGLETSLFREVVCADARQCGRALAALRDEVLTAHAQTLARLVAAELLDPAAAAELKPEIEFSVHDSRDRRTFPLPAKLKGVKINLYGADADPADDSADPPGDEPDPDAPPAF